VNEIRCGGGGGGIHGAVTVTFDGSSGAALIAVADTLRAFREDNGDNNFDIIFEVRDIGGDGGLVTGALRMPRFIVLTGCGVIVSFRQSCDWCKDDGARIGDEGGNLMLCARATLALLVKFNFLGGGNGFCREIDGTDLVIMAGFTNSL